MEFCQTLSKCVALLKFTCNCQHSSFISTMENNTYYLELYWCLIPNSPYMIKFLWIWRIIIVKSQKTERCQDSKWQTVFNGEAEIKTCQLYPFHVASLFVFSIIHIPLRQIAFLLRMPQAFEASMLETPSSQYFKRKESRTKTKMVEPN